MGCGALIKDHDVARAHEADVHGLMDTETLTRNTAAKTWDIGAGALSQRNKEGIARGGGFAPP